MPETPEFLTALNKTIKKWEKIVSDVAKLEEDIHTICPVCLHAEKKAGGWGKSCDVCNEDVKTICRKYITGEEASLVDPSLQLIQETNEVFDGLKKILESIKS